MLPDFKDFPATALTLEFWMRSVRARGSTEAVSLLPEASAPLCMLCMLVQQHGTPRAADAMLVPVLGHVHVRGVARPLTDSHSS
jgi:hypothetical protein